MGNIFSNLFSSKSNKLTIVPRNDVLNLHVSIIEQILNQLKQHANVEIAKKQSTFHKTNDVESKDIFLGVSKQVCKQIAQQYANTATFNDISQLLNTPNNEHEIKLVACMILITKATDKKKPQNAKIAYDFYFKHLATFTSWDLIDETAPVIIGNYLQSNPHYPRDDLYRLVKSRSDWDKRIALAATEPFIQNGDFTDALELCKLCFNELSPMVLKTAGKTLKEIGKYNKSALFEFLANYQTKMPKEMLNVAMGNLAQGLKKTIRKETKVLLKK